MGPADPLAAWAEVAAAHLADVAAQSVLPTLGDRPGGDAHWQSATQVVTAHDDAAGAALAERFARSFPGHGLIVEDREPRAGDGVHTWSIDPIDGSANHLRGIPYVSLTAGLVRDGVPVIGVVHDLLRGVSTTAIAGRGAYSTVVSGPACSLGDGATRTPDDMSAAHTRTGGERRELRLDSAPDLADAMAIVHIARRGPLMGREGALARLLWGVRKIRCMGSIALDLALLARGEADLLVAGRGRPQRMLDIIGGLVVLNEAGGVALDANGAPHSETSRTLIAGAPSLCHAFVELMAEHELEAWSADDTRPPA